MMMLALRCALLPPAPSPAAPASHRSSPPLNFFHIHRHFGVVRALLEANLLPRVCSGSSAGSIGESC